MWETLALALGPPAFVILLGCIPYLRDYRKRRRARKIGHEVDHLINAIQADSRKAEQAARAARVASNKAAIENRKKFRRVK